jgi:hypothetical protein
VGAGLGAALGVALLIIVAEAIFFTHRRRQENAMPGPPHKTWRSYIPFTKASKQTVPTELDANQAQAKAELESPVKRAELGVTNYKDIR